MASFNKIILIGNLVADPELKQTNTGISYCSFSIAVGRRFTKQGDQNTTDFFEVTCWREKAEFVTKFFTKGKPILVCGEMHQRSWTDNNGAKRYAYSVAADELSFVERKGSEPSAPAPSYGGSAPSAPSYGSSAPMGAFEELSTDDELPF
jgi:single-strand DNA-binding protein